MSYDTGQAARLRAVLDRRGDVTEKRMFGGLTFMVSGHMCCGVTARDLMFRVGPENHEAALKLKGVRACDFTGRPLTGLVMISFANAGERSITDALLGQALQFVSALPPRG